MMKGQAATIDLYLGVAGLSGIVLALARNGGEFAVPGGAMAEKAGGGGWYTWAATAEDMTFDDAVLTCAHPRLARAACYALASELLPAQPGDVTAAADYIMSAIDALPARSDLAAAMAALTAAMATDTAGFARAADMQAALALLTAMNQRLRSGMISLSNPIAADGVTLTIYRGASYTTDGASGLTLAPVAALTGFPNNLRQANFSITLPGLAEVPLPPPVIDDTAATITFLVPLSVEQTNQLYAGPGLYSITATWDAEHAVPIARYGACTVI